MSQTSSSFSDPQGFWTADGNYISHWQCCDCNKTNKILDKNRAWDNKLREPCTGTTTGQNVEVTYWTIKVTGPQTVPCRHDRCHSCFNLNPLWERIQYCDGMDCE